MSGVQIGPGATALTRMPLLAELLRERLREGDLRRFGHRVVDQLRRGIERLDRTRW